MSEMDGTLLNGLDERPWDDEEEDDAYVARLESTITRLRAEVEAQQLQLAACGVIAMANTPESAKEARDIKREYWSASAEDVAKAVDREMALRADVERLRSAILDIGGVFYDWAGRRIHTDNALTKMEYIARKAIEEVEGE